MVTDGTEVRKERKSASAFESAVLTAYLTEHGTTTKTAVAKLISDVSKTDPMSLSALSQLFKNKKRFDHKTLDKFLAPIAHPGLRAMLLRAYETEAFPSAPNVDGISRLAEKAATLGEQNRPDLGLELAKDALSQESGGTERWTLFLLATKLSYRLDRPDESMEIAGMAKFWGDSEGRSEWSAAAHAVSARAMRRTLFYTARDVQEERQRASTVLSEQRGLEGERLAIARFARDLILSETLVDRLQVQEARGGEEEELRKELAAIAEGRRARATSGAGAARGWQLEARIRLALRELDAAEGAISKAIESRPMGYQQLLECDHLAARLLAERCDLEGADRKLVRMAHVAGRDMYVYLQRLATTERARLLRTSFHSA